MRRCTVHIWLLNIWKHLRSHIIKHLEALSSHIIKRLIALSSYTIKHLDALSSQAYIIKYFAAQSTYIIKYLDAQSKYIVKHLDVLRSCIITKHFEHCLHKLSNIWLNCLHILSNIWINCLRTYQTFECTAFTHIKHISALSCVLSNIWVYCLYTLPNMEPVERWRYAQHTMSKFLLCENKAGGMIVQRWRLSGGCCDAGRKHKQELTIRIV